MSYLRCDTAADTSDPSTFVCDSFLSFISRIFTLSAAFWIRCLRCVCVCKKTCRDSISLRFHFLHFRRSFLYYFFDNFLLLSFFCLSETGQTLDIMDLILNTLVFSLLTSFPFILFSEISWISFIVPIKLLILIAPMYYLLLPNR